MDPSTYEAVLSDTASQQLGFDLSLHPQQRWVVEALFLAPLPQGVVRCYDAMGRAYYFDQATQSSSWAHPCAKQFEALLQAQAAPSAKSAADSSTTASSLPPTPKRKPQRLADNEEKTNTEDEEDSGSDDDGSETTNTTAATSPAKGAATRHSKSFLRSNAGLSSTSSLFLTEEELAHWNDGAPPLPPPPPLNRRGGRAARGGGRRRSPASSKSSPWINDELGGRDGERWAGEDGEPEAPEVEQAQLEHQKEAHAAAARMRASSAARARVRASRPSSAYPISAAAASSSSTRSWNSAQPQPFHPWANARGTGDTEHLVPHPGSLIAPAPFAPAAPAPAGRASLNFTRPSGGAQSHPTSAFHGSSSSVDAAFRAQQSQQIREGHKMTRARINGSLRSKASHLYTLRATLLTKLRALSRLHDGALTADEKSWRDLGGDVRAFTAVNDQRTHLFRQAFPMLDAEDARALGRMLHRSSQELEGASARVSQALLESSALKAQVLGLQQDLQREVEHASESLRIDAQCLEMARTGLAGDAAAAAASGSLSHTLSGGGHAPSTSLPRIHELLDLVLHFQNHARTHGAKLGARLVSEKKLLAELTRANQIVLRRGAQHASERREQIMAACLANKATIPGQQAQLKDLQANLQAQIEPLSICQRTYELRRNESSLDGGIDSSSVHLRDENLDLLHRLEDELAALTTLVAHLESEFSLAQSTLSASLDRDRTLKAEASTEEVRSRFYRSALAVQPGPSYVPLIRRGSTQNQTTQQQSGQPPQQQDRPRSREASPSRLGAPVAEHQQASHQWSAAPPPHPSQSRPTSSKAGATTRPSSSQSVRIGVRPASAASTSALSASDLQHERNQLVRDQAANLERLRTRKVRRAKIAQGAASKQELLIPSAGRPVFEGGNDGYES